MEEVMATHLADMICMTKVIRYLIEGIKDAVMLVWRNPTPRVFDRNDDLQSTRPLWLMPWLCPQTPLIAGGSRKCNVNSCAEVLVRWGMLHLDIALVHADSDANALSTTSSTAAGLDHLLARQRSS